MESICVRVWVGKVASPYLALPFLVWREDNLNSCHPCRQSLLHVDSDIDVYSSVNGDHWRCRDACDVQTGAAIAMAGAIAHAAQLDLRANVNLI